jgi:hypothetical protein
MSHDPLSDVPRSVRLRGGVFYYVSFGDEWAAGTPAAHEIAQALMTGTEHVLAYPLIAKGGGWAATDGEPPARLAQGDIVMFPRGDPHGLSSAPGLTAQRDDSDWQHLTRNDRAGDRVRLRGGLRARVQAPGRAASGGMAARAAFVEIIRQRRGRVHNDCNRRRNAPIGTAGTARHGLMHAVDWARRVMPESRPLHDFPLPLTPRWGPAKGGAP